MPRLFCVRSKTIIFSSILLLFLTNTQKYRTQESKLLVKGEFYEDNLSWDVLVIHSGWEQIPESEYVRALNARGFKVKVIHDFGPLDTPRDYQIPTRQILSTSSGVRTLSYRKYTLWNVASYDVALRCGKPLTEILQDPVPYYDKLNASYAITAALLDKAEDITSEIRPRALYITQGYLLKSSVFRAVATMHSHYYIKIFATENTFHKNKLTWDSIAGISVHSKLPQSYYARYRDTLNQFDVENYVMTYFNNTSSTKQGEHLVASDEEWFPPKKSKKILFIAQVNIDSAVLYNLFPAFPVQADVIRAVLDFAVVHDHALLIKFHPKECGVWGHVRNHTLNSLLSRHNDTQEIILSSNGKIELDPCKKYNTYSAIEKADLVVTINSQTGLEAAAMKKPVITTATALYGGLGFSEEARNREELHHFMSKHLEKNLERGYTGLDFFSARGFLYVFLEKFCINRSADDIANLMLKG